MPNFDHAANVGRFAVGDDDKNVTDIDILFRWEERLNVEFVDGAVPRESYSLGSIAELGRRGTGEPPYHAECNNNAKKEGQERYDGTAPTVGSRRCFGAYLDVGRLNLGVHNGRSFQLRP